MKKMITLLAAIVFMVTTAQAQAVTQRTEQSSTTVTRTDAQKQSAQEAAPVTHKSSYGLYEEDLPRSVKRTSTTRTVREGDAPAAEPMKADTVKLQVTPSPRGTLSSQMAPPERASGKVMRTRSVRTIAPATQETPAKTEEE
ncbi:MAG: hypothetical protein K5893_05015 [Prevotella sp.]|nr:hypothetical protein [Prevotella sp.]